MFVLADNIEDAGRQRPSHFLLAVDLSAADQSLT